MSKRKSGGNLTFAIFFFVFIGGIIALSLFFRFLFLLKETKFDGSSHFTLEVKGSGDRVISFSPSTSTIGILSLKNISAKSLEIPIDAKINSEWEISKESLGNSLFKMSFDFKNQKELNFIDILRLFLYEKSVKENAILEKEIDSETEKIKIDSIVTSFFVDTQISEEKLSIEIVNSTETAGLGNRLANFVSNIGGNVVLVTTGDLQKESEIQFLKNSYTVDKLVSILKFKKVKKSKNSLADVIIIIGKDSQESSKF